MKRKIAISTAVLAVLVLVLGQVGARAADANQTLKLKLRYNGAETVDTAHPLYVLVFDADPYTAKTLVDSTGDATPPAPEQDVCHILRRVTATRYHATLTFSNLSVPTVYVIAFLDKSGKYDGHSNVPPGSPMTIYGKGIDQPEPIHLKEGKTTVVSLNFDDSYQAR